MFAFLGVIVGLYTTFAAFAGKVYARSRFVGGGMIERDESPVYFWTVIACYAALAIALVTVF
jgi:hypothetical protein